MNTKFLLFLFCSASVHLLSLQFLPWGQGIRTDVNANYNKPLKVVQIAIPPAVHERIVRAETTPMSYQQEIHVAKKNRTTSHMIQSRAQRESKQVVLPPPPAPLILKEGSTLSSVTLPQTLPHLEPTKPSPPPSDINLSHPAQEHAVLSQHATSHEVKQEKEQKIITTPPLFRIQYLNNPQPPYPMQSRQAGEFGKVILSVYVNEKGVPLEIKTKKSSGFERLDESARTTIAHWRFVAAKRGQEQIAAWVNIPIEFNLPTHDDE